MQETWVQSLGWEDLWRRKWQLTPVPLPGKSHGWVTVHEVAKESEMTERINNSKSGQEERGDWHKATQRIHRSGLKPGGSDTIQCYSAPVVTHVARHNALFYLTIHSFFFSLKTITDPYCVPNTAWCWGKCWQEQAISVLRCPRL